jgi:uncharacterized protein YyaL (SSP411 family)
MKEKALVNRLGQCTSPYLLQHASNPVAWQPWDDETIEEAKRRDLPMLVSIGYAACHWCHVMEHESFDNEATAALMNELLVCVKVDREERPDVDALYMSACQAMTGAGGWPLNAFVDPHTLKPFFAGTYFPPEPRYGRSSWSEVVISLTDAWRDERDAVLENATRLTEHIEKMEAGIEPAEDDIASLVGVVTEASVQHALQTLDTENGGFGGAPKFPNPMKLEGLLRHGSEQARTAVEISLEMMANRGLYDHLGGGWHRYCVDAAWAVPHFEKMLYDNALLLPIHARALSEGVGDSATHQRVIRLTLEWLNREMLDPDGGVWSTLDADSDDGSGHSEEGEFYLWTPEQVIAALGESDGNLASQRFTVTEKGNYENSGRSVLAIKAVQGLSTEQDERLRSDLLKARESRPRPGTDDKILTAWNGMLLVACAGLYDELAEKIGKHIAHGLMKGSTKKDGFVLRTRRGSTVGGQGFLDDYAWASLGLLLWGIRSDNQAIIGRAVTICDSMLGAFKDPEGGFWMATKQHGELPIGQRDDTDSAVPAASAIVVRLLATMLGLWPAHASADNWRKASDSTLTRLSGALVRQGPAYWAMLNAVTDLVKPWSIWFVHHDGSEPEKVSELRRKAGDRQLVVASTTPDGDKERGDEPWKAWLCEGMTRKPATTDESDLSWK